MKKVVVLLFAPGYCLFEAFCLCSGNGTRTLQYKKTIKQTYYKVSNLNFLGLNFTDFYFQKHQNLKLQGSNILAVLFCRIDGITNYYQ
ncbi:hypothetical protein JOD96_004532 [Flavobacterium sp. 1355]|jgi:hypothetical protein|nr:hypothetical protein [Flavobacterium sp. 1355]